jgi:hypothetical protein
MLGLTQMFNDALPIAEAMGSQPEVVKIGGDEDKSLWTEIYLCQNCYLSDVNLAWLAEITSKREDDDASV